jgi:hypothetical protein
MDDIRRQDRKLFVRELLNLNRLTLVTFVFGTVVYVVQGGFTSGIGIQASLSVAAIAIAAHVMFSWNEAVRKRFLNARMRALWAGCEERLVRFEEAIKRMRKEQVADLREMPATIRKVAESLYAALRRADLIAHEVQQSEQGLLARPPAWQQSAADPQSQELYRLADRNIAEYRANFAGVMAGVERTEGQAAVFMTTLDSLRIKILGYRLVGRSPEMASHEFLTAIAEARAQFDAIDTALDELDLSHFPKQISVVPPPPPDDVLRQRMGQ